MDKIHFIHNGFNEAWKFFKENNPKTEADWEYTMAKANELCEAFKRQDTKVGELMEKIVLAILEYKEKQ